MPQGHLLTPWLVAQGMEKFWHIPPCSRDTCSVVVGRKTFPRGSFPTTRTGSLAQWAASSPGTGQPWAPSLAACMARLWGCFPWWPWLALWLLPGRGGPCGLCPGYRRAWQHPALLSVLRRNEAGVGDQLVGPGASWLAHWPCLPQGLGDVTQGTGHGPPCPCWSMCQAGVSMLATACEHSVTGDGLLPGLE